VKPLGHLFTDAEILEGAWMKRYNFHQ